MEHIYWRHPTVPGIKVEEVSGEHSAGAAKVWLEMARQVYCENGREAYREIGHFKSGVPFLYGETSRISITHCDGLLAVATLPPTPEVDLDRFSERAALGIDAERADREQVLKIRERFLSDSELEMIPADDLLLNVQAWTVKEAAYKAALATGVDFRSGICIKRLPKLAPPTPVYNHKEFGVPENAKELPGEFFGEVTVESDGNVEAFRIYSYMSDECVITLCYAPRCAKFGKSALA